MRERVELGDTDESILRTMDTAAEMIGNFVDVTETPEPVLAEAQTRLVGWLLVRDPDGRRMERDDTYSVGYGPAAQAPLMHSGAMMHLAAVARATSQVTGGLMRLPWARTETRSSNYGQDVVDRLSAAARGVDAAEVCADRCRRVRRSAS